MKTIYSANVLVFVRFLKGMKMRQMVVFLLLIGGFASQAAAQWCGTTNLANAGTITPGTTRATVTNSSGGSGGLKKVYWAVNATAGRTYVFDLCNTGNTLPRIRLYNGPSGSGTLLATGNVAGNSGQCANRDGITWSCTTTGTYYLLVTYSSCTGNFSSGESVVLGHRYYDTSLPIELLTFSANCSGEAVTLNWTTASERNNAFFLVERSYDAENWEPVQRIDGANNSNMYLHYKITDSDISSADKLYYRLTQQDFDGTRKTFDPVVATCKQVSSASFSLYPNPSTTQVTILFEEEELQENVRLSLYSITGQLLQNSFFSGNRFQLELSAYPPGIYLVELWAAGSPMRRKLVIE